MHTFTYDYVIHQTNSTQVCVTHTFWEPLVLLACCHCVIHVEHGCKHREKVGWPYFAFEKENSTERESRAEQTDETPKGLLERWRRGDYQIDLVITEFVTVEICHFKRRPCPSIEVDAMRLGLVNFKNWTKQQGSTRLKSTSRLLI